MQVNGLLGIFQVLHLWNDWNDLNVWNPYHCYGCSIPIENIRSKSCLEYTRNDIRVSDDVIPPTFRMRSVTTFAMSSLVLTLMIAARSYRPAIEYTSLTPSMSAIASATLLILSLSTVRRTIADTIGYLLNFQWSHGESIFSPYQTEYSMIHPKVN